MRTGSYVSFGSLRCFDPRPLPPDPPIRIDGELAVALSEADRALARLDGATLTLPDPDLFVYAFMRQEAVLSSQIEGTQASLDDLLEFESGAERGAVTADVIEVVRYLDATRWALAELPRTPVSLRLIKEMHRRLLSEGRGAERAPGEFRRNQNWIGPPGCSIEEASFVPPAVPLMDRALNELEAFIHSSEAVLPPLIRFGLVHSQFETIHPFWDGNGRLGRMLGCVDGLRVC
jgi:Fic family protein